jgi:hypothetical protein
MALNWEQIIRDCYDPTTNSLKLVVGTHSTVTTNTRSEKNFEQCYEDAYDSANSALTTTRIQT